MRQELGNPCASLKRRSEQRFLRISFSVRWMDYSIIWFWIHTKRSRYEQRCSQWKCSFCTFLLPILFAYETKYEALLVKSVDYSHINNKSKHEVRWTWAQTVMTFPIVFVAHRTQKRKFVSQFTKSREKKEREKHIQSRFIYVKRWLIRSKHKCASLKHGRNPNSRWI